MDEWMNELMNGWMNYWMNEWRKGWINSRMNEWIKGRKEGWRNERKDERKDEWKDEWMHECMKLTVNSEQVCICPPQLRLFRRPYRRSSFLSTAAATWWQVAHHCARDNPNARFLLPRLICFSDRRIFEDWVPPAESKHEKYNYFEYHKV